MELDGIGDVAQVGHQSDFNPLRAEAEADRIDGVVRNGEAVDLRYRPPKRGPGLKTIQAAACTRPRGSPGAVKRVMKMGTLSWRASATRPLT